ncbi:hypothetical protein [Siccirubricoccus sp. G192]|uniref:hypothetical protein n=1 Tax=Siccirubricoccus sp. G192 TaxID=2849651 RepID=UPI001C2BF8FC|nr:hypothetical protein [Siccirubricoccus sp. G192]MBV1799644.1 hypothetical protein [Siccirubricoccus sp. G192]
MAAGCGMAAKVRQRRWLSRSGSRSPATEIGVAAASARRKPVGGSRSRASSRPKDISKSRRSAGATISRTGRPSQAWGGCPMRLSKVPAAKPMRPSGETSISISAAVSAKVRKRSRSATGRGARAGRSVSPPVSIPKLHPYPSEGMQHAGGSMKAA